MWLARLTYCVVFFLLISPFLFRKSLHSFKVVTKMYMAALLGMIIFMIAEFPFFKADLTPRPHVNYISAPPSLKWFEQFFGLIQSYYAQQYFFSVRRELDDPSSKRLRKMSKISVSLLFIGFSIFAVGFYLTFGDEATPEISILRRPFPNMPVWSECLFRGLVLVFLFVSLFSLPLFNIPIKTYLNRHFRLSGSRFSQNLIAVTPLAGSFLVCLFCPSIIDALNFFSVTVFNFNGYFIPILLTRNYLKAEGRSYFGFSCLLWFSICLFVFVFCNLVFSLFTN